MNGTVSRLKAGNKKAIEPGCEIIVPSKEQKKKMRVRKERYFDLEGLPSEEVRKLLEDFVWERGKKLAPSSLGVRNTIF